MNTAVTKTPTEQADVQIEVADHPLAWRWLRDRAAHDAEGFARFAGDNRRRLERIYGKPTWTNDGSKGWTSAWAVQKNSLNWVIYTGPGSTMFRVRSPGDPQTFLDDSRVGPGLVNALKEFYDILTGTEP